MTGTSGHNLRPTRAAQDEQMNTNSPDPSSRERLDDEAAAQLAAILNTVVDAIITIDASGIIQMANPAVERLFGFTAEELIGRNVNVLMPSPDRELHDQYVRNYLKTGTPRIIGVGRDVLGQRKDGSTFPARLAVSELRVGDSLWFTGIIHDITDLKAAEEEVRLERDFANSLIQTAHAMILVLNTDGTIARFNPYMEELTGYALSEVKGQDWFETFIRESDRDELRKLLAAAAQGKVVHNNINPIVIKGGRERVIAWSARRLQDRSGHITGVLAIGTDVTQLKEAEMRALRSERLAAIGQMVTGLAHESRNALQRIRSCIELLELDLSEDPNLMSLLDRAGKALDELHRLYEEVRSYAAPLQLGVRTCDIHELCRETWAALADLHEEKGVQLCTECAASVSQARCDPERLQQVLRNIFENALAVSPDKSAIEVRCEDCVIDDRPGISLQIRDHGPGLTGQQLDRVFEPFFTTKSKGTGLGMAIAKRLIDAHAGTLSMTNADGGGARVEIRLPR